MKKLLLFVALFFALFTVKTATTHAQVYSYWEGIKFQKYVQHSSPKPNFNYSVSYCSRHDHHGKGWFQISRVCQERGVQEYVHGKRHIWVGFQHGKQDMFFNNREEALAYVFDRVANKAHWARDVYNQKVYFNAYGLRLGQKNQRNQWFGKYENVWKKAYNGKWMYRKGDYFVTHRTVKINGRTYKFDNYGYLVGHR